LSETGVGQEVGQRLDRRLDRGWTEVRQEVEQRLERSWREIPIDRELVEHNRTQINSIIRLSCIEGHKGFKYRRFREQGRSGQKGFRNWGGVRVRRK